MGGVWRAPQMDGSDAGLQRGGNSVIFVVKGDGKEFYRSALIQGEETQKVNINVEGVRTLELITEDAEDGNGSDWSVWFNPQILR